MTQQFQANLDLFCPACGYNLRGTEAARCPECGVEVDRAVASFQVIPWSQRAHLGTVTAFARTVRMIIGRPSRAAQQVGGAVSYREAQRFRILVVLLAGAPLWALAIAIRAFLGNDIVSLNIFSIGSASSMAPMPWWSDLLICLATGIHIWPMGCIAILLALLGISGTPSFFFDQRHDRLTVTQRNRAVALSFYACAPLALIVVPASLFCGAAAISYLEIDRGGIGFTCFGVILALGIFTAPAIVLSGYVSTLVLMKRSTHCSNLRVSVSAILLPLVAIAVGVIGFVVVPMIAGYIKLIILTQLGASS